MFTKRNRKMSLFAVIFAVCLIFVFGVSIEKADAVRNISLATGTSGGTWYPTGALLADLCNKKMPEIHIAAEVTSGSGENIRLIDGKKIDLCFLNGLAAYWAWNGVKPFFDHKVSNLRSLFYAHGSTGHIVVLKRSKIKTWKDLAGKRIATGSPTGNEDQYPRAIFKAYGFSDREIEEFAKKFVFLTFTEGVKALKDGRIDAAQVYAAMPNSTVMDIASTHDIDLVGLTKDVQQKLAKEYPYFVPETIPANTYKGVDHDVLVVGSSSAIFAEKDFPEDLVYTIVKTVHENIDTLAKGHIAFKKWRFNPNIGNLIPLHEGAKRYYKELGLLK
jgi:TRAP transporter TAXI family solute receptor